MAGLTTELELLGRALPTTGGSLRTLTLANPAKEEFALAGVPKKAALPAASRVKNPSRWNRRSEKNRLR